MGINMTVVRLRAVGFCAHYSKQGDWAFQYALSLSRRHSLQLNVFHFLSDPYDPLDTTSRDLSKEKKSKLAIDKERELRMYYDEQAGDYLDVGFRLCEDNEWTELHRCLVKKEFQILVLGFRSEDTYFGGRPILEFANNFISPVVLVGPKYRDEFYLNASAALISERLGLGHEFIDAGGPELHIKHCFCSIPEDNVVFPGGLYKG
jgi:hypothetical protein